MNKARKKERKNISQ